MSKEIIAMCQCNQDFPMVSIFHDFENCAHGINSYRIS
jgi:hypothetical protein